MPTFFFHLASPGRIGWDEIGCEFPSLEAAYLDAHRAAFDIGLEMIRDRVDPSDHCFQITDSEGRSLIDLPFIEALQLYSRRQPTGG